MKNEAVVPGAHVRGSSTGRPLMATFDLLGRRGTLRLIWELRDGHPRTFRALQEVTELAPATLNTRLRELRAAGLMETRDGYRLTALGSGLLPALEPLHSWAARWAKARGRVRRA